MTRKIRLLLFIAFGIYIFAAGQAFAQEAYIAQIGSSNRAANVDLTAQGRLVSAQIGSGNSAAQINATGSNLVATVQSGDRNQSASVVNGVGNTVLTAQLGMGHQSLSFVAGNSNNMTTVQTGSLNYSMVDLAGSKANVSVAQNGVDLASTLNIRDFGNSSRLGALNVGLNQSRGDPEVNATVTRDRSGTISINPGTATTVLRLSG